MINEWLKLKKDQLYILINLCLTLSKIYSQKIQTVKWTEHSSSFKKVTIIRDMSNK